MVQKYDWVRFIILFVGIIGVILGRHVNSGDAVTIISVILLAVGLIWSGAVIGRRKNKK